MKTLFALILMGLMIPVAGHSQLTAGYTENVKKAEDLYSSKDFAGSARAYSLAFALNGGKGIGDDRYNAACSYAMAGNADSAFFYLFGAAERNKYDNYSHIIVDTDLTSLQGDKRWQELLNKIKENKDKAEANFIKPVVAILDTVYQDDQKWRAGIAAMINKEGMQSPKVQERLRNMRYSDSVNLLKIQKILDEYGWLGFDKVGRNGAVTIFLVIQHSPLPVQQKYLPMMREAVAKKQAFPSNLALLEDRVAMGEGRKQIYGSQVNTDPVTNKRFVVPLQDPDHVDERRAAVGLGPLAEYLKSFGIEWNLEEYKKQQSEAEKNKKQ